MFGHLLGWAYAMATEASLDHLGAHTRTHTQYLESTVKPASRHDKFWPVKAGQVEITLRLINNPCSGILEAKATTSPLCLFVHFKVCFFLSSSSARCRTKSLVLSRQSFDTFSFNSCNKSLQILQKKIAGPNTRNRYTK